MMKEILKKFETKSVLFSSYSVPMFVHNAHPPFDKTEAYRNSVSRDERRKGIAYWTNVFFLQEMLPTLLKHYQNNARQDRP